MVPAGPSAAVRRAAGQRAADIIRAMNVLARALAAMTPTHRARVPAAWALYDFANTIFTYTVVSLAIGLWLTDDTRFGPATGQLVQGLAVAISVGCNALVSPVLGALSDRGGRRLPFLLFFTILAIVPSALIGPSPALVGAALFTIANFGYQAALIYYDATLSIVSTPASRGRLSGLGVAVGYTGTISVGLLLLATGIATPEQMFLVQAILFAIFATPIFLIVREPAVQGVPFRLGDVPAALGQLGRTLADARSVPGLTRFLAGRFFYSDAVNTLIVVMSVIAVRAMGFTPSEFVAISLGLTMVAIAAAFGWGMLVDRYGPRRTLIWVLGSWAVGLMLGAVALSLPGTPPGVLLFLLAGGILGSGLGGVQVADRVFMLRLAPPSKIGEFFGLYGLAGKASQVVGQLLYSVIVFLLLDTLGNGAYQLALLSLLGTMLLGLWLIRPVSDRWAERAIDTETDAAAAPVV
jgi:MFS transporter, UMF1 family